MTFSLASLCNPDAFKRENLNTSLQSSRDSKACYYKITVYGPVTVITGLPCCRASLCSCVSASHCNYLEDVVVCALFHTFHLVYAV